MDHPASKRDFVAGPTESGKTHLLRVWLAPHKRQLVLDATGEWLDGAALFDGEHVIADSQGELGRALQDLAEAPAWRVVIPVERVNLEQLTAFLVPASGARSYPRLVGGMALVVDEAYEVFGHDKIAGTKPLMLRSRHHGLSILSASQRPADVGRAVTSMSGRVATTATIEPVDRAYFRRMMLPEWYEAFLQLRERQAILIHRREGRAELITTAGIVIRQLGGAGYRTASSA